MENRISRRSAVKMGVVGSALLLQGGALAAQTMRPAQGPNPMFPERHLKVLGFFAGSDKEWYERVHAPDFFSFAAPHMARYARNWVTEVETGAAPSFGVITEIHYKSEHAKHEVRRLMNSPAGNPLMEHMTERRAKLAEEGPPPPPPTGPVGLFPVAYTSAAEPNPSAQASESARRVMLLRSTESAGQDRFTAAVEEIARDMAALGPNIGVSTDLIAADPRESPADAVIFVDNFGSAALPAVSSPSVELVSVLRVDTRRSGG